MTEKIKIRVYAHTGFVGCSHLDTVEIDRSDWNLMGEKDREKFLEECAQEHVSNHIDYGAYVEEGESE